MFSLNSSLKYSENDARKYGWTPRQSKGKLIGMYANYLDENVKIINEKGIEVIVKRVQTIKDIWLLSEIMNFTESGNFDRISGHIGATGFIHFLEKNYIYPKVRYKKSEEDTKVIEPPKKLSHFKPQNRTNKYFRSR